MFLFVAMTVMIGCSNDDSNLEEVVVKGLLVNSDSKEVIVGNQVMFTVLDQDGEKIDATIYVDDKEVINPVVFELSGEFDVVAKKEGYQNSNLLTINVVDKEVVRSELVLTTTESTVKVGAKVSFVITADNMLVEGVTIYNIETGDSLPNNIFEATEKGMFSFIAKKEGFVDSVEVVVTVEEEERESFLKVNGVNIDFNHVVFDVIRENITDEKGNRKEVDKVVKLDNGRFANEYSLMILEQDNYLIITLWVENKGIIEKDGVIVNYGKRVLPINEKEIVFSDLFLVGDYFIIENYLTTEKFDLEINYVSIPNNGVGAGVEGVFGTADFGFGFVSEGNEIDFSFAGEVFFTESLEKDSKALKLRNR